MFIMEDDMKKIISVFLVLTLVYAFSVSAYAETAEDNADGLTISTSAAMNGVYQYNVESQQETFLPTSKYRDASVTSYPQYMPNDIGENDISPYTVTDPDGRWKVTDTSGRYANTVLLKIKFPGQNETWATGWMIGPNTIATAGHCVYKYGCGWAEYIIAYLGTTGGSKPYGGTKSVNLWAGGDYVANDGDYSLGVYDDWGVIEVESNVGDVTGWLGIVPANSYSDVAGRTFQTNGYPSDLDNEFRSIDNKWMYSTYGTFTGTKPRFLPTMYMDIDFAGGQSGSAIYRYVDGAGYAAQAIGVAGNDQTIVVLINDWLYDFYMSVR